MLLLSRNFRNIGHMKKYIFSALFVIISISGYSQKTFYCKNFNYEPAIDTTIDGVWHPSDTVWVDSTYITNSSIPNYYDLGVTPSPDLELKYKALWYDSTIYFLFRRYDDILVNGYNEDNSPDNTVADSLVNRDATAIYFHLKVDQSKHDTLEYHIDTVAWIRFVWQSDDMEAQLPGGEVVNSFEDFHSEIIQWQDSTYYWAKLSVNLGKLAPYMFEKDEDGDVAIDTAYVAFEVELNENDKEVEPAPYAIQTRAYFGTNVGENALEDIANWSWLYFFQSSFDYVTSLKNTYQDFAAIYPVPAKDYFTIRLEKYDNVSYYLYDMMGRLVLNNKFEGIENEVEVHNLSTGTYILRLRDSKGVYMTQKMLIAD